MDQDLSPCVTTSASQADLAPLRAAGQLGEYAVVYRVERLNLGGGFGNQKHYPMAWAVFVYVDGALARIYGARGEPRKWNNLDRLERWLREQGFWYWRIRNDLEALGVGAGGETTGDEQDTVNLTTGYASGK